MELELLITELDQTTIQLDKINFLATRIMSIASEKTKHAKNALEYDFESQEIFKCSTILLDYVEMSVLRFPLRSIGSGDKRQIHRSFAC